MTKALLSLRPDTKVSGFLLVKNRKMQYVKIYLLPL